MGWGQHAHISEAGEIGGEGGRGARTDSHGGGRSNVQSDARELLLFLIGQENDQYQLIVFQDFGERHTKVGILAQFLQHKRSGQNMMTLWLMSLEY